MTQRPSPRGMSAPTHVRVGLLAFTAGLLLFGAEAANALGLHEAIAAALTTNPRLRASRAELDVAAKLAAAARRATPLEFEAEVVPFDLGPDSELSLSLSRELPLSNRRGAAVAEAAAEVTGHRLEVEVAAEAVTAETRHRYRELALAQEVCAWRAAARRLDERLVATAQARSRFGEVSDLELGLWESRAGLTAARHEDARAAEALRRIALASWIGLADTTGLVADPTPAAVPPDRAALEAAVPDRADLRLLAASVDLAIAGVTVARAERREDPAAGVLYRRGGGHDGSPPYHFIGGSLRIPLTWPGSGNGNVDLARARVGAARITRDAALEAARSDFAEAWSAATLAAGALETEATRARAAERWRERAEQAWSEGRLEAAALHEALRSILEVEELVLERKGRWYAALERLEEITGRTLIPAVPAGGESK